MFYRQGTYLTAKADFTFKAARQVKVKAGQVFWVTTSDSRQRESGLVHIARKAKGSIGNGYAFNPAWIPEFFEVESN